MVPMTEKPAGEQRCARGSRAELGQVQVRRDTPSKKWKMNKKNNSTKTTTTTLMTMMVNEKHVDDDDDQCS